MIDSLNYKNALLDFFMNILKIRLLYCVIS